jgi:hypothetical protein
VESLRLTLTDHAYLRWVRAENCAQIGVRCEGRITEVRSQSGMGLSSRGCLGPDRKGGRRLTLKQKEKREGEHHFKVVEPKYVP